MCNKVDSKNTHEYFTLVESLIKENSKCTNESNYDKVSLIHDVLRLLKQYQSHENENNDEDICDRTLCGLVDLASCLLEGAHKNMLISFKD